MAAVRRGRNFAGIMIALAAALWLAPAAEAQITLRFSSSAPPADFLAKSMTVFKETLEQSAPGQFKVEVYPGNMLFRQGTEIPAMQRGNLDMSTGTTFEIADQIPELGFFNRAYLFRDYEHLRKVFDGPLGAEYRKKVADKMGIEILAVAYLGTRQLALRKAMTVKGPQDLAGVKLRVPSGPEWQLLGQAIGTTPVPMAMAETYLALKTGSVDGQDNPLSIFNAAKFYEVSEQVVLTAHMVQPVFIDIAKPVWDKLAPEQQQKVEAAAKAAQRANDDARRADETQILAGLKTKGLTVTTVDLAPFRANADKVYATADLAKPWDRAMMQRVQDTH
ncbi:MAG TPA: DctP family TRAP transporter solute-binding subunit [Stellaceae bacterium]|nr:DctP family TRAP transporter solute-binding subunit [Stellaceae bacterium]